MNDFYGLEKLIAENGALKISVVSLKWGKLKQLHLLDFVLYLAIEKHGQSAKLMKADIR